MLLLGFGFTAIIIKYEFEASWIVASLASVIAGHYGINGVWNNMSKRGKNLMLKELPYVYILNVTLVCVLFSYFTIFFSDGKKYAIWAAVAIYAWNLREGFISALKFIKESVNEGKGYSKEEKRCNQSFANRTD